MPSLKIAVGYDAPGNSARVFPIYVGHSGEAMRLAVERSTAPRVELFPSAFGLRKNNPRAAANAARLLAEAKGQPDLATEANLLLKENISLKQAVEGLMVAREERDAVIESLRAELATLNAKRGEATVSPAASVEIPPTPVASAAEPEAPAGEAAPSASPAPAAKAPKAKAAKRAE